MKKVVLGIVCTAVIFGLAVLADHFDARLFAVLLPVIALLFWLAVLADFLNLRIEQEKLTLRQKSSIWNTALAVGLLVWLWFFWDY